MRRFLELQGRSVAVTEEEVLADIRARDERDSTPGRAPFKQACDAGNAFGCHNLAIRYRKGEGIGGSQALAAPGLPLQQNSGIGVRHLVDEIHNPSHGPRAAHDDLALRTLRTNHHGSQLAIASALD